MIRLLGAGVEAVLSAPIWNSRNIADLMSLQGATHDQYLAFERVFRPLRNLASIHCRDIVTLKCLVEELAVELTAFPRSLRNELFCVVDETVDLYTNPELADALVPVCLRD